MICAHCHRDLPGNYGFVYVELFSQLKTWCFSCFDEFCQIAREYNRLVALEKIKKVSLNDAKEAPCEILHSC